MFEMNLEGSDTYELVIVNTEEFPVLIFNNSQIEKYYKY